MEISAPPCGPPCVGTNLSHDFTAVTFSVKFGVVHEKLILPWNSTNFHDFPWFSNNLVLVVKFFYLVVIRNNSLAYLCPNYSNHVLIRNVIAHHPVIYMWQCRMRSSFICIFVFLIVCLCQKCSTKNPDMLHANILLLYTDRTSEKACEISMKFRKPIREMWHVLKKLPSLFPCSKACQSPGLPDPH